VRLLITGGAGCLGSNLVEFYLPQGHEILVIDNFATGRREVLPEMPGLTLPRALVRLRPDARPFLRPPDERPVVRMLPPGP